MAFHFANLRGEFDEIRKRMKEANADSDLSTDLECFAFAIHERLSPRFGNLPARAFHHHEALSEMAQAIFQNATEIPEHEPWVKTEAELLKRLVDFELSKRDLDTWNLTEGGIDELVLDFKSLADYLFGEHHEALEEQLDSFGVLFLQPEAITEYQKQREANPDQARNSLRELAMPLVEPMWFFVVSLCRLLQGGEYGLNATDAYWLGIVDEVIGEKLPTFRLIAENPEA